jgi:hypothetical protein
MTVIAVCGVAAGVPGLRDLHCQYPGAIAVGVFFAPALQVWPAWGAMLYVSMEWKLM